MKKRILLKNKLPVKTTNKTVIVAETATITRPGNHRVNIAIEGNIRDFLGINIEQVGDTYRMTQPQLIKKILMDLHLDTLNVKAKDVPMASSRILHRHGDSPKIR